MYKFSEIFCPWLVPKTVMPFQNVKKLEYVFPRGKVLNGGSLIKVNQTRLLMDMIT